MESKKKPQAWLPLLFSITLIVGMLIGYRMRDNMPGKQFFSIDKSRPLQEIIDLLEKKYVDKVNADELSDTAIEAMLSRLDPHSVYISASDVPEYNDDIAGNFFGIGVEFDVIDDTINIMYAMPGSPAAKAGVQTGDKFIYVNDTAVAGVKIKWDKIKTLLRGPEATTVAIDLLRGNERKKISVKRGLIPVSSIDAAYMIEPGTGLIRLNKFSQSTYREFMEQLEKLKGHGMDKMILDLRGNGGGVLEQAVEVADEFLDGDKLITYTAGAHFPKKEHRCKRPGLFEQGKLVVLCDEGTASASEVLIGALQDWDRGTIIGRRSFGKGLVQEQYSLSNGSAVRLTIARYYTPLERSIQRPYKNGEKAYYDDIMKRYHDGEMQTMDSIKNDTTKKYTTPAGRTLYGGGGITPNIFVPFDSSKTGEVFSKLYMKGTLNNFAYLFYLKHKPLLASFKNIQGFASQFTLSNEDWIQFEALSLKDSVGISQLAQPQKSSLMLSIKSAIARLVWRNEGMYEVENTDDITVKKALEALKN